MSYQANPIYTLPPLYASGIPSPFIVSSEDSTGRDLTAKQVAQTPSARIYVANLKNELHHNPNYYQALFNAWAIQTDKTLTHPGANQIATGFDHDNVELSAIFGQPEITDFNIYVEPGFHLGSMAYHPLYDGGPRHYDDNITVILDANPGFGSPNEAMYLTDCEAVESYEDRTYTSAQRNSHDPGAAYAWDDGLTNGESLSRALASELQPEGSSLGTNTAAMQDWWRNGHADYINGNPDYSNGYDPGHGTANQASDTDPFANGCGTLFLFYLHEGLGYSWSDIIHAKGETLGDKYQDLTGNSGQQGFQDFLAALTTKNDATGDTELDLLPNGVPNWKVNNPNYVDYGGIDGLRLRPGASLNEDTEPAAGMSTGETPFFPLIDSYGGGGLSRLR